VCLITRMVRRHQDHTCEYYRRCCTCDSSRSWEPEKQNTSSRD
jgi:hypothetical protein